jgi:carboxyl-terminal processing protease
MKRYALVGVGGVAGFAAALMLFPAARGATDLSAYHQLDLFSAAFEKVRESYVRPVEDKELVNNAIEGMVSALDPHSSYMDAKTFADMQIQTKGEFGGLGIEVTMEDGLVKVISPIDDTPAAKAGLKTGDFIAAINATPIQGMALNDAIDKMRGPNGSKVSLTILRPGTKKPFDVTLTRAVIRVDSVKYRREGDVGYIRISAFNERTDSGLQKAIHDLKAQIGGGLKGYVIDLRNDPGGLLDQAVDVSDDLLTSGEIVSTRGRHTDDTQRYAARGGDITDGKPVVVLVNGGTASASEIVAGALQDNKRAKIVGMTSFGKGSVQTIIPLGEGGGALRLTTARYYTPSGHSIQAQGIIPDYAVSQGDDEDAAPKITRPTEADLPGHLTGEAAKKQNQTIIKPPKGKKIDDFQLSYALDLLHGGKPVAAATMKSAAAN